MKNLGGNLVFWFSKWAHILALPLGQAAGDPGMFQCHCASAGVPVKWGCERHHDDIAFTIRINRGDAWKMYSIN